MNKKTLKKIIDMGKFVPINFKNIDNEDVVHQEHLLP